MSGVRKPAVIVAVMALAFAGSSVLPQRAAARAPSYRAHPPRIKALHLPRASKPYTRSRSFTVRHADGKVERCTSTRSGGFDATVACR